MARPCTGRRVSSLVPWGGSEKPETVKVSQDVVNRRRKGGWEGKGAGDGAGEGGKGEGEGAGAGREGEGEGVGEGGEGEGEGREGEVEEGRR